MKFTFIIIIILIPVTLFSYSLDEIFGEYGKDSDETQEIGIETFTSMVVYAISNDLTGFSMLNEVVLYLKGSGMSIRVPGRIMREVNTRYSLGGGTVNNLLPIEKIDMLYLGRISDESTAEFELYLEEKHYSQVKSYLDFYLDRHCGFKNVQGRTFTDPFGMKAGKGIISFNLKSIEMVQNTRMMVNVLMFSRELVVKKAFKRESNE
jgi:hypothetical protein